MHGTRYPRPCPRDNAMLPRMRFARLLSGLATAFCVSVLSAAPFAADAGTALRQSASKPKPSASTAPRVTTKSGPIEGTTESDGLRVFKGIPFAAPPVGKLRWQPPQAVEKWTAPRAATTFGDQCMQRRMFADMVFRASGNSEDC